MTTVHRADLDEIDREALDRAIALTLEDPDPDRAAQVRSMLETAGWWEVSRFCCYHKQFHNLNLKLWEATPSWISPGEIDAVIARGDEKETGAARLLKRMLAHNVSRYEPDPLGAIERAKARRVKA
jgi:hypothetical protein